MRLSPAEVINSENKAGFEKDGQTHISRRQMLKSKQVIQKIKELNEQQIIEPPKKYESFESHLEKTKLEIGSVCTFIDKKIEDEAERMKIKHSLSLLEQLLKKHNTTLEECIKKNIDQLGNKEDHAPKAISLSLEAKNISVSRFEPGEKDQNLDFVHILECASSLKPLLNYQK